MKPIVCFFILALFLLCACEVSDASAQHEDLGDIDFPTSGGTEAQKDFIRGVLLLHSFEYWDARRAFQTAQSKDADFAMAYWGEAMTHNHPVWNSQNQAAGKSALEKLGKTATERLSKAPTEREKDYLRTLDVLYGEGSKEERDLAYSEVMKALVEKYPDDLEAASFYSLSILGTAQGKRDFRIYMRAGAIALQVFEKNSRHPGAAHYVIHSFDDPIHAPLGLPAAHVYADIAAAAPHALHMPSHIFMALGMWEKSSASNEASRAASLKKGDSGLHATWWLTYSYLQQGKYKAAQNLITNLEEKVSSHSNQHHRSHLAYMRTSYLIETRQWDAKIDDNPDVNDYRLQGITSIHLAEGIRAIQQKQVDKAEKAWMNLKNLPKHTAKYSDEETHAIMVEMLAGYIAHAKGDNETAIIKMETAASLQEDMSYEFGPTIPIKPVYELFGEIYLGMNAPKKAIQMFRKALNRDPRRALSLKGLAKAAKIAGDETAAKKAITELKRVWQDADENTFKSE